MIISIIFNKSSDFIRLKSGVIKLKPKKSRNILINIKL
jgi:hypothetical protein